MLELNENALETLPESIGMLQRLESAEFCTNRLASLPETITQCAALARLDISSNALEALPDSMGQLTALEDLYASNNRLCTLPYSLTRLARLETVYLSHNRFEWLDDWTALLIGGIPRVDLSYNRIHRLPVSIDCVRLESLDVQHNALTRLPRLFSLDHRCLLVAFENPDISVFPATIFTQQAGITYMGVTSNTHGSPSHHWISYSSFQHEAVICDCWAPFPPDVCDLVSAHVATVPSLRELTLRHLFRLSADQYQALQQSQQVTLPEPVLALLQAPLTRCDCCMDVYVTESIRIVGPHPLNTAPVEWICCSVPCAHHVLRQSFPAATI